MSTITTDVRALDAAVRDGEVTPEQREHLSLCCAASTRRSRWHPLPGHLSGQRHGRAGLPHRHLGAGAADLR
jgi:hypothetical protein